MYFRHIYNKHILLCISFFCICFTLCSSSSFASENSKRIVRVGYDSFYSKSSTINEKAIYSNVAFEYIHYLAQYANWELEYIAGRDRADLMQKVANGEIDFINFVMKTPEREKLFDFSNHSTGVAKIALIISDNTQKLHEPIQFCDLRIGFKNGHKIDVFSDYCTQNALRPTLKSFVSFEQIFHALSKGTIDAALVPSTYAGKNQILLELGADEYFFVVKKGNKELLKELNSALEKLKYYRPNLTERLHNKYFHKNGETKLFFSESELEYIHSKPQINVLYDGLWPPFEYKNPRTGKIIGLMPAVYKYIEDACGLKFTYIDAQNAEQAYGILKNTNTIPTLALLTDSVTWAKNNNVRLTQPIFNTRVIRITNEKVAHNKTYNVLAQVKHSYLAADIAERFPTHTILPCLSAKECLDAVLQGKAYATYLNEFESNYLLKHYTYRTLETHLMNEYFMQPFSIVLSQNSDPRLFSILSKTIHTLSLSDLTSIAIDYSFVNEEDLAYKFIHTDPRVIVTASVVLLLIFAIFIYLMFQRNTMKQKNKALQHLDAMKSDFLSRISHDIRTPMNAILGVSELGKNSLNLQESHEYFEAQHKHSQYLLDLINNVLDARKLAEHKMTLNLAPCSPLQAINQFMSIIHQQAEEKDVTFTCKHSLSDQQYLLMDKTRFMQIFTNLLNNAIKFTAPYGSVIFSIEQLSEDEKRVTHRFTVQDTGRGMSEEFSQKVFAPFEQEQSIDSEILRGSGLGLNIVHSLVALKNGSIHVKSKRGKGTTFTIILTHEKVQKEQLEPVKKDSSMDMQCLQGKRVLMAEDNAVNVLVLSKMLQSKGITVECTQNGKLAVEAFEKAPAKHFDLILMDIRMPVMNGITATQTLRNLAKTGRQDAVEIPIIFITADELTDELNELLMQKNTRFLQKPVEPEKLYALLLEELQK